MGVDSSGAPNFRAYPFVENGQFCFWFFACMKLHSTVQPMGFDSSGGANFCAYPFLETDPFGASGDTALTPAARNYLSPYPPQTELGLGG